LGRLDEASADFRDVRDSAGLSLITRAGVAIGEADVLMQQGRLAEAEQRLQESARLLREANLKPEHVLHSRQYMTEAALLTARGRDAEAAAALTRGIANYEAQDCCMAHVALALAHRAELALKAGDAGAAAAADARRAIELAPSRDGDFTSRFTGSAWFASGLVHEAAGKVRKSRDAFAVAAVQFAGSVGEEHPDTLRARDAISRLSARVVTKNHN
jgi:tetratricopeptide (TPR) repeat protein